jgi:putative flippase GtrA
VVLYLATLWLLSTQLGLHYLVAWAIAAEAAVMSNFILNRNFTWFERRSVGLRGFLREVARYHAAAAVSVGANFLTLLALKKAGLDTLAAGAVSVWVGVATSFLGAERFVFTARRRLVRRRIMPQPHLEDPGQDAPAPTPAAAVTPASQRKE